MKALLKKLTLLVPCVVVLLAHLSPVSLAPFTAKKHEVFQIENQPYEFECTLTGTQQEIENSEISWFKPGPSAADVKVVKNDPEVNVTVKKEDGKLVSTLRAPGPPGFIKLQHYRCIVDPEPKDEINQHGFVIIGLREKGVPKIQLGNKLEPARFKEAVVLNCSVSYENTQNNEFTLIMSWKKDGKTLAAKTYDYKIGRITEKISYSFVITSHTDGGDYTCSWELTEQNTNNSISRKSDVNLQILPFLAGPTVKEVSDVAGSDVKLECDIVGYPIKFEWRDEDDKLINGSDSRFRAVDEVLYINDIDYKDRQGYKCLGIGGNETITQTIILRVKVLPFLAGPTVKEVSDVAGSDVKLECDIVGYPIKFEWRDEENKLINGNDSRFRAVDEVLYINDIDYKDRQGYKCLGIGGNETITQTIILRVKVQPTNGCENCWIVTSYFMYTICFMSINCALLI